MTDSSGVRARAWKLFLLYLVLLCGFVLCIAWAESAGMPRRWIGPIFDPEEYYVAGRRVPAFFNGMACAADWMSAASFISLAGGLYLLGFGGTATQPGGLAYVMGWTGGFVLVALLIAPHLRRMNLYTVPDYFMVRYGGAWPRRLAALSAVLCSLVYLVAQIYGIGLIASRLTGVQFEIGIMLGLGGVLLCSFLGGMRAITWTQVAQYVVMLLAFLIPVSWLAYKQLGHPLAPVAYGELLITISEQERKLAQSPVEQRVQQEYWRRAGDYAMRLQNVPNAMAAERSRIERRLSDLKARDADSRAIVNTYRELAALPRDEDTARERWTRAMHENLDRARQLGGMPPHLEPFGTASASDDDDGAASDVVRRNFLALMFCLMVGTAGLPHLLTRYYTTSSVSGARRSVAWTLAFILLLYLSAPALAAMIKFEVMSNLVGQTFDSLPGWILQWARVDPALVSVEDINGDRIVQFSEIRFGGDIVMLATPELGGMPYVVAGLVAAGGLAAALSTADGLLLTITNSVVRDLYCRDIDPAIGPEQRVILSKFMLMTVALAAAFAAALKPGDILALVSWSFSIAASAFVPAMVMGICWRRVDARAAVAGMLAGLVVTLGYMTAHAGWAREALGLNATDGLWFGIQPVSAGVFGVPAGVAVITLLTLLRPRRQTLL
ncbi:MAG: cation acetate symporter [Betaproteobacteria bacterium]|nr:cation acetate symporter [Betaproteobacteria bacterium]